jgi:hypothetical protein
MISMAGAKPLRTLFTMISPELKILYLLHALAYSYAPGKLACGVPGFAIILKKEHGKDRRKPP